MPNWRICPPGENLTPDWETIQKIDRATDRGVAARLLNESALEANWSSAAALAGESPVGWLLRARLAEAALLCAGNYADNCEFQAAGDLLVNPRKICVHWKRGGPAAVKKRHQRLSDQFRRPGERPGNTLQRLAATARLEVAQPPLLPHMTRVLVDSGRIAPFYLHHLAERQRRIADTLAFLAAWGVADAADLRRRLIAASPREKAFAQSRLCRFDTTVYRRLGDEFHRCLATPAYTGIFLAGFEGRSADMAAEQSIPSLIVAGAPA